MKSARFRSMYARRKRFKELSLGKLVPNILTLMALSCGLSALYFALHLQWSYALLAIMGAALLDGTDGRMARMLGACSTFGAELDSLADLISFGIAPSMLLYLAALETWGAQGWTLVLFYVVCCALRLARFNTLNWEKMRPLPGAWPAHKYFTGVPSPAGALIALTPAFLSMHFDDHLTAEGPWCWCYAGALVFSGGLMVSRLPTFSFKSGKVPYKLVVPALILSALLVMFLVQTPWLALGSFGIVYIGTLPLSIFSARRYAKKEKASHPPEPTLPGMA